MQSISFVLPTHYLALLKDHLGLSSNSPKLSRLHFNELFIHGYNERIFASENKISTIFFFTFFVRDTSLCLHHFASETVMTHSFVCNLICFCGLYVCKICIKLLPGVTPTKTLDTILVTVIEPLYLHFLLHQPVLFGRGKQQQCLWHKQEYEKQVVERQHICTNL